MPNGKYYKHLPKWPSFSWSDAEKNRLPTWFKNMTEDVDGDVPTTRLSSWREFHEFVQDTRFEDDEYMFRGHYDFTWDLVPSIARSSDNGVYQPLAAKERLESFRRSSRGRKEFDPTLDSDSEMWALGQHHGLQTPLLDWTLSPYVALFFAFEKDDDPEKSKNWSRVVFALNKTQVEQRAKELSDEGWKSDQLVKIYQPAGDTNRRLLSQAGLFLEVPPRQSVTGWILNNLVGEQTEPGEIAKMIMKVHIPNEERRDCLRTLQRMNIHHASLFPDLIGSCAYSNFETSIYSNH